MAFGKMKLAALFCALGLSGNQAVNWLTVTETQPDNWEIVLHPDYNHIYTARHRYTGHYADPMDVYIQTDGEGAPIAYQFHSTVPSVPEALLEDIKAWGCGKNERGLLALTNIFTGETIPHQDLRLVQPLMSEAVLCSATHRKHGYISALAR